MVTMGAVGSPGASPGAGRGGHWACSTLQSPGPQARLLTPLWRCRHSEHSPEGALDALHRLWMDPGLLFYPSPRRTLGTTSDALVAVSPLRALP